MKRDFFSEFAGRWEGHDEKDWGARLLLLCEGILENKTKAQERLKDWVLGEQKQLDSYFAQEFQPMERLGLIANSPDLATFPSGSFLIHFTFRLRKPYISKDDTEFYIIDNPVRKDKVFKVPYVASTSWKGALRAAMVQELVEESKGMDSEEFAEKRFQLALLFGDEKGEGGTKIKDLAEFLDEAKNKEAAKNYRQKVKDYFEVKEDKSLPHHRGRLVFFPTFFKKIDLEVINPHDRKTGAGTLPIYIESVPENSEGNFTLLYVPFDRIGRGEEDKAKGLKTLQDEMADDLKTVAEGVQAMFTKYGFGAKTSSGFGRAILVAEDTHQFQEIKGMEERFAARNGLTEFPRWDDEELAKIGWGKRRQNAYKRLRSLDPDWDSEAGRWREPSPKPEIHRLVVINAPFGSTQLVNEVEDILKKMGEAK